MRKALIGLCGAVAALFAVSAASAQQTVKIGIILPYSGQFADGAQPHRSSTATGARLFIVD